MTDLTALIQLGWQRHDTETDLVAKELKDQIDHIPNGAALLPFLNLFIHTVGSHLNDWVGVTDCLDQLERRFPNDRSIHESHAMIALLNNDLTTTGRLVNEHQLELLDVTLQAAKELIASEDLNRGLELHLKALDLTENSVELSSKSIRLHAIVGNNLASALEAKPELSEAELFGMFSAAKTGRLYWALAGGWLETERAEYVLAACYLKANQLQQALSHARLCEQLCLENDADSFEIFFVNEMFTKIYWQLAKQAKELVPENLRNHCEMPDLS